MHFWLLVLNEVYVVWFGLAKMQKGCGIEAAPQQSGGTANSPNKCLVNI